MFSLDNHHFQLAGPAHGEVARDVCAVCSLKTSLCKSPRGDICVCGLIGRGAELSAGGCGGVIATVSVPHVVATRMGEERKRLSARCVTGPL